MAEEEKFSPKLEEFEPKICSSEKTAVVFLGTETEDPEQVLSALDELQGIVDLNMGVLDLADPECEDLIAKYKIDKEATQLIVFQNCEKISGISLEGDYKQQVQKLKESLQSHEQRNSE